MDYGSLEHVKKLTFEYIQAVKEKRAFVIECWDKKPLRRIKLMMLTMTPEGKVDNFNTVDLLLLHFNVGVKAKRCGYVKVDNKGVDTVHCAQWNLMHAIKDAGWITKDEAVTLGAARIKHI